MSLLVRKVTTNRITHNDLELGSSEVRQVRYNQERTERQIELNFIFRSADEIRSLDLNRYTRVSLHREGQCYEYWFDAKCGLPDDDDNILQPNSVATIGRWRRTEFIDHWARAEIEVLKEMLKNDRHNS